MSLNLIYDRGESDITAAKEIRTTYQALGKWENVTDAEKAQLERGTLTYNTLNRVESAVTTLAAELNSAGYPVEITETSDWLPGDTVTREQWETYLENVQKLRDAYYTLAETGAIPKSDDVLTWEGANNIEKVLADIELLIGWMKSSYRRCGTFNAGENSITLPLKGSV